MPCKDDADCSSLSDTTAVIGSIVDPSTHAIPAYTNFFHRCKCSLHTELMSRFARQSSNTNDPLSPHTVALQHLKEAHLQDETRTCSFLYGWIGKSDALPIVGITSEQRWVCLLGCTVIHSQTSDVCS